MSQKAINLRKQIKANRASLASLAKLEHDAAQIESKA